MNEVPRNHKEPLPDACGIRLRQPGHMRKGKSKAGYRMRSVRHRVGTSPPRFPLEETGKPWTSSHRGCMTSACAAVSVKIPGNGSNISPWGCGQKLDHPDGGPDWGPHVHEEREDEDPRGALGERASPRDRGGTTRLADARDAEAVGGTGRRRRAGRQASREALPREAPPLRPQGEGRGAEAPLRRRSHARHQGQARDREQDGDLVVGAGGPGW